MPRKKTTEPTAELVAFKGFDKSLACRGFQFEVGKTYEHDGPVVSCESGFHACKHPLAVLEFCPPATSRYAEVKVSGDICDRNSSDTKIAAGCISIEVELSIGDLTRRAVQWVLDRAKPADGAVATSDNEAANASGKYGAAQALGDYGTAQALGHYGAAQALGDYGAAQALGFHGAAQASGFHGAAQASGVYGAAQASGDYGAAQALGFHGAAQASGDYGAAQALGDYGAAQASGFHGAAQASGFHGAAQASGKLSHASATGPGGRAMAVEGASLTVREFNADLTKLLSVASGIAGRDGIKPNVWYRCVGGKLVEA